MATKTGDIIRVEYIDHATIRKEMDRYPVPPVLVSIGILENIQPTFIELKSLWSLTTGSILTKEIIIRSCIKSIQKLRVFKKEEIILS